MAKNPGFKFAPYPFPVIGANHQIYFSEQLTQLDPAWLLSSYYQYCLDQLVQLAQDNNDYENAWIFKVDGDHIYSPELLQQMIAQAKRETQIEQGYFVGKLNIFYAKPVDRVYCLALINNYDHFFYKLSKLPNYCLQISTTNKNAYETLDTRQSPKPLVELFYQAHKNSVFLNSIHYQIESRLNFANFWENTKAKFRETYALAQDQVLDPTQEQKLKQEFYTDEFFLQHHTLYHLYFNYEQQTQADLEQKIAEQGFGKELLAQREFFSPDNIKKIYAQFDWSAPRDSSYLIKSENVQALLDSGLYRSDASFTISNPIYILEQRKVIKILQHLTPELEQKFAPKLKRSKLASPWKLYRRLPNSRYVEISDGWLLAYLKQSKKKLKALIKKK